MPSLSGHRTAGVAIAGEIDEVDGPSTRTTRAGFGDEAIDVGQPGLAGRRAGAGDLRPAQRVDQTRLADVRPSNEGDLCDAVARDAGQHGARRRTRRRARDEVSGEEPQRRRRSAFGARRSDASRTSNSPAPAHRGTSSELSSAEPRAPSAEKHQCVMVSSEMAGSTSASAVVAAAARTGNGPARAIFSTSSMFSTM